jgi:hypothetical protein
VGVRGTDRIANRSKAYWKPQIFHVPPATSLPAIARFTRQGKRVKGGGEGGKVWRCVWQSYRYGAGVEGDLSFPLFLSLPLSPSLICVTPARRGPPAGGADDWARGAPGRGTPWTATPGRSAVHPPPPPHTHTYPNTRSVPEPNPTTPSAPRPRPSSQGLFPRLWVLRAASTAPLVGMLASSIGHDGAGSSAAALDRTSLHSIVPLDRNPRYSPSIRSNIATLDRGARLAQPSCSRPSLPETPPLSPRLPPPSGPSRRRRRPDAGRTCLAPGGSASACILYSPASPIHACPPRAHHSPPRPAAAPAPYPRRLDAASPHRGMRDAAAALPPRCSARAAAGRPAAGAGLYS